MQSSSSTSAARRGNTAADQGWALAPGMHRQEAQRVSDKQRSLVLDAIAARVAVFDSHFDGGIRVGVTMVTLPDGRIDVVRHSDCSRIVDDFCDTEARRRNEPPAPPAVVNGRVPPPAVPPPPPPAVAVGQRRLPAPGGAPPAPPPPPAPVQPHHATKGVAGAQSTAVSGQDVLREFGDRATEIVRQCVLCDAMQGVRASLHDTLAAMKTRQLPPRSMLTSTLCRPRRTAGRGGAGNGTDDISDEEGDEGGLVLPFNVWARIGEYLPAPDLMQLPVLSRALYDIRDDAVWGTLYERNFPLPPLPLEEGTTWRALFLANASYMEGTGRVPALSSFLRGVCPTGSFKIGAERMQIIDYSPRLLAIQQRHTAARGGDLRLEAFAIPTIKGPVTITAFITRAAPDAVMRRLTVSFDSGFLREAIRTVMREH